MVKKVELTIHGSLKKEPFIYNIIKRFDVIPNIIEASFATEMGWAVVEFDGDQEELERLFSYLKSKKGVDLKFS